MFKGHMSFLYVGCMKFPTNRFVRNLIGKRDGENDMYDVSIIM
jgi:hypothetical protein